MKTYVTFGQAHKHNINGKEYDKDCVAVIACDNSEHGRDLAFRYFGAQFAFEYPEERWNEAKSLPYYPRGYVEVT